MRKLCRDLEKGVKPEHTSQHWPNPVPTYGGDTVLKILKNAEDDSKQLRDLGHRVMDIQFEAESMKGQARDEAVIDALKRLEAENN